MTWNSFNRDKPIPKPKGPLIRCKRCKKDFYKYNDFVICPQCQKETLGDVSKGVQILDEGDPFAL